MNLFRPLLAAGLLLAAAAVAPAAENTARWNPRTTSWNAHPTPAVGDWGFDRPSFPAGLYLQGVTVPEGEKVTNPVIYDNDVFDDVFDDELTMVMASEGEMNLAGLIVTPVLTDGWGFSKPEWIKTAHKSRRVAEQSGLRMDRIPPITVGTEAQSEKAGEGQDSVGARLYIRLIHEQFARDPQRPLLVNIGGQGATLASAYTLDPSIADQCLVYYTDLRVYNGHYAWASQLIAKHFRVVSWGDDHWWITKPGQNEWRVLPRPDKAEGKDNDAHSGEWRLLTQMRVPLLDDMVKQFQTRGEYCQGERKGDGYLDGTFLQAWLPGIFEDAELQEVRGGQVLHVTRFTPRNEDRVKAFANQRLLNPHAYQRKSATPTPTGNTASPERLNAAPPERLRVSDNQRLLVTTRGQPFFWLGDTAWELFHRLDRAEADFYLRDRAAQGFTVIQAVALAELDGLTEPDRYGHLPLEDMDPARPAVKPGPANDYWDFVDEVMDLAAAQGLRIGFLPTWGKYVTSSAFDGKVDGIFNVTNALVYGQFLGTRYRDRANLIWILGGDKAPSTPEAVALWRAMARGIALGATGREDDDSVLMTYHTAGPGHVSDFLHDEPWLDFTSAQSSHGDLVESWRFIEKHWARQPIKPVIDLESSYPDALIPATWLPEPMRAAHPSTTPSNDDHARRAAYWAVFAGAFGHTYGHNSIWQMYVPPRKPILSPRLTWKEALDAPSARQMGYLRGLIESRPFLSHEPDQTLIAGHVGEGADHIRALRSEGYAMVYTPSGKPFTVRLDRLTGKQVKACWYNPRTGKAHAIGQFDRQGDRQFVPPGTPGVGNDWVLVLDDPGRGLGPPRTALEPFDWRGFGGFDTHAWRGFLLANNRWGGGNGRIWLRDHGDRWSFWTEHSDDLNGGHVKSFPHAGIGWMWGNWAPNQALPIPLSTLVVANSDWTVTLPETEPNQSYVVYYQLYTSAVPDPKSDGAKINGDLAIIIHREDFPFEAWGQNLGEFDVGGRKWLVVKKAPAIGKSTDIILIPVTPVARREGQRLTIEDFDLKPCLDFCVAQGFYQPADYLLTIQVGWESRVLHGVLRSEDLRLTVGKKGAKPVRLPFPLPAVKQP